MKTGCGIYYSSSRKKLWKKGETSGNTQKLLKVYADCDRDSLIFVVQQKNGACHTGKYSCFSEESFNLEDLERKVSGRLAFPTANSYTVKVASQDGLLSEKIMEEASEVVESKERSNLKQEIADLTYFLTIKLAKNGLKWKDVFKALAARSK